MNAIATPLSLPSDAHELLDLLAYIYLENDRPEKAAVLLAALEALGQADVGSLSRLALAQLRSNKPELAQETLERLAMKGQIDAVFHLLRAQALQSLNRGEEAHAAMRSYIALRQAKPQTTTNVTGRTS